MKQNFFIIGIVALCLMGCDENMDVAVAMEEDAMCSCMTSHGGYRSCDYWPILQYGSFSMDGSEVGTTDSVAFTCDCECCREKIEKYKEEHGMK